MKKWIMFLMLMFAITANAQECQIEWCSAPWPPLEGQDRTVGVTNCGDVCFKIKHPDAVCPTCPDACIETKFQIKGGYLHYFKDDGTVELFCLPPEFDGIISSNIEIVE